MIGPIVWFSRGWRWCPGSANIGEPGGPGVVERAAAIEFQMLPKAWRSGVAVISCAWVSQCGEVVLVVRILAEQPIRQVHDLLRPAIFLSFF
jgi:hypothetical protein